MEKCFYLAYTENLPMHAHILIITQLNMTELYHHRSSLCSLGYHKFAEFINDEFVNMYCIESKLEYPRSFIDKIF